MRKLVLVLIVALIATLSFAETIKLKNGDIVEGKIVERTDEEVKVDTGVGVNITYYSDQIDSVDGKPIIVPEKKSEAKSVEVDKAYHVDQKEVFYEEPVIEQNTINENQYTNGTSYLNRGDSLSAKKEKFDRKELNELSQALTVFLNAFARGMNSREVRFTPEYKKDIQALGYFWQSYPDSRFSDDAEFLALLLGFDYVAHGATKENKRKGYMSAMEATFNGYVSGMEKFVLNNLGKKIEAETIDLLGSKLNILHEISDNPPSIFIPYDKITYYMKGHLAFIKQDFDSAKWNFTYLKERLDFSWDKQGMMGEVIFGQLIASNMALKNVDEARKLAEEAKRMFPGVEWPQGYLDLVEKKKSWWKF